MAYNGRAMEPRIQYAQTADGVSIAFFAVGEGVPIVLMPSLPFSHIQMEWQWPEAHGWYERLATRGMLVRYDCRGSGLSQRDVTDYSLDAHMLDLEAVRERLKLDRFVLVGPLNAGPVAIGYAARSPERVSHLILWCAWAEDADIAQSPQVRAFRALRDQDWRIYTETVAYVFLGRPTGEEARQLGEYWRECVTQEAVRSAIEGIDGFDASDDLQRVSSPTLVVHIRDASYPEIGVARSLASRIADASLVVFEGDSAFPWRVDMDAALAAIVDFVGGGVEARAAAAPLAKEDVHTILISDMEGSTTLTQRLGDARAQDVLHTHNAILRDALKAHGGSEIKHTGDGIMASFASASRALECAIAMQRAFARHNESNADVPIRVRIGLNAGEPVAEEEDLFGTAVQLAARVCAHAEPGQILVAIVVRELAAGKKFLFADLGETALRGFEDPVRLYEVSWREER
jgi:class 3 adenylate cyclase/pimeloyl-ACP methyl ester carboxylesterase